MLNVIKKVSRKLGQNPEGMGLEGNYPPIQSHKHHVYIKGSAEQNRCTVLPVGDLWEISDHTHQSA